MEGQGQPPVRLVAQVAPPLLTASAAGSLADVWSSKHCTGCCCRCRYTGGIVAETAALFCGPRMRPLLFTLAH